MPQVINTNIASLNAQRNLNRSQDQLQTSLERLSTGLRINSAKDDAAGLAISERFTSQIKGLEQATRNANDGISFAQTAEGALGEIGNALQRIRELSVQSANDTNSASDREALNNEVSALVSEVNRIAQSTQFNGQNVLDGSLEDLVFQVGANRNQTISVDGVDARGAELGAAFDTGDAVTASGVASITGSGALTINGVGVDISDAASLTDSANVDSSTISGIVSAINAKSADTGVTATQASTTETTISSLATGTTDVTINGVTVSFDSTSSADATAIADRLNEFSSQTGVSASADGTGTLVLTEGNGGSIDVSSDGGGIIGGAEEYFAGIELATDVGESINVAGGDAGALGLGSITATDSALNGVSVQTREDATATLRTVDFALDQVNGLRAELGAVQSRFESTIANLSTTSENLSAARSRIRDADFAAETASLTKAQILQQAGTSVLSQANSIPQNVLSLLQ
ncbi:flagellin [Ectothiorhodospiraceae bacterium WFHF3C12]|nr:flagellin [Ectothiorhodospiraceae bacterium WFHF3C12]